MQERVSIFFPSCCTGKISFEAHACRLIGSSLIGTDAYNPLLAFCGMSPTILMRRLYEFVLCLICRIFLKQKTFALAGCEKFEFRYFYRAFFCSLVIVIFHCPHVFLSYTEGNLTIHEPSESFTPIFGRAPFEDLPCMKNSSIDICESLLSIISLASLYSKSKFGIVSDIQYNLKGSNRSPPILSCDSIVRRVSGVISLGFNPCFKRNLSVTSLHRPSGIESLKTPKSPSNGSCSAIKSLFSNGNEIGLMLNPFVIHEGPY